MWAVVCIALFFVACSAQPVHHRRELYLRSPPEAASLAQARYHAAFQDNFDGSNTNTWQQAYFVNDTFWKGNSDAPVFLCVGGEGPPMDGSYVQASDHCNIAVEWLQSTGALMFALEHRYYGCHNISACPVSDFNHPDAFRFQGSRQALSDVAHFYQYAMVQYSISPDAKWITWGGSYPGMLAGWSRTKFPHLFHGAVSSSAPVYAEVEMQGYYDIVAFAFSVSDNNVGGSEKCSENIADGHRQIGTMFSSDEGRSTLAALFKLPSADWLKQLENQRNFAGYGVAQFDAQSNDPLCTQPACNIASICHIMTDGSIGNVVERLAHVAQAQTAWARMPWEVAQYRQELSAAANTTPPWFTFWDWQTCTEFGFYQTCNVGTKCFFTQGLVTLDVYLNTCKTQFGIPAEQIPKNIEFSNTYYGGLSPSGSRVLYPNGEVDPWRANSIQKSPGDGLTPLFVAGASHHAWTHTSQPGDQASVIAARTQIRTQVAQWLKEE